jgi:hypothetical protein
MLQESTIVQRLDRLTETLDTANILKVSDACKSELLCNAVRTVNLEGVKFFHLAVDLHGSECINEDCSKQLLWATRILQNFLWMLGGI